MADIEEFSQKLANLSDALGYNQPRLEPAGRDEEYGVFSEGDHAATPVKRVPKPSYRLQENVANVLIKAQHGVYPPESKKAICSHNGIDEDECEDSLSQQEVDEKLLPMIARELPDSWDIADVSSAEVARMRQDFLLDT